MSSENGIPVMNKPVNTMEAGANAGSLAAAALKRHPIEEHQHRNGTFWMEGRLVQSLFRFAVLLQARPRSSPHF